MSEKVRKYDGLKKYTLQLARNCRLAATISGSVSPVKIF